MAPQSAWENEVNALREKQTAPVPEKKKSSWAGFFGMLVLVVLISLGLRTFVSAFRDSFRLHGRNHHAW